SVTAVPVRWSAARVQVPPEKPSLRFEIVGALERRTGVVGAGAGAGNGAGAGVVPNGATGLVIAPLHAAAAQHVRRIKKAARYMAGCGCRFPAGIAERFWLA